MRFSSYQIHHIMQVYVDKLRTGEDNKERFYEGNLPSRNGISASKADSQLISERIVKDITGRISDICNSGIDMSELESSPEIIKDKDNANRENKNYVFNVIDENGKKISRAISLKDSEFLIKNHLKI